MIWRSTHSKYKNSFVCVFFRLIEMTTLLCGLFIASGKMKTSAYVYSFI